MKIIFSPKCIEYKSPGHPESPQRVSSGYEFLKQKGFEFVEPSPASDADILLVHTQELLDKVKNLDFDDPDTPALNNIFEYAALSAGAAITAMKFSLKGQAAFSLMRPPGHHATRGSLGGFCYFNNIAIAVKKASATVNKLAILDIDCHHGNGTEDIFLGQENILFVSLHRVPLYPGTGLKSNKNCLNYPLSAELSEFEYLAYLQDALSQIKNFKPALLAVSAGFDTYKGDPVAGLGLGREAYRKIGSEINALGVPYFCVLEGGYSRELPECLYEFMKGLTDKQGG
jgi:acetoin utilization deacetylase AcuC-like enzyme